MNSELAAQEDASPPPVLAMVRGHPLRSPPRDLYIPEEALGVALEEFEGPLDLLLYLIKRQRLDVMDIDIAVVSAQYLRYIEWMEALHMEVAGEYLVMAATLAELKSRLLLPRPQLVEEEEEDPRTELMQRLAEYERFRKAAAALDALPRLGREFYAVGAFPAGVVEQQLVPYLELPWLAAIYTSLCREEERRASFPMQREPLSMRERMQSILRRLRSGLRLGFRAMFHREEGRAGVIVALLALLELARGQLVEMEQESDGKIYAWRRRETR